MVKPLPINNQIRGTRRYAAPDSVYFRAWFAQKQRKDRKEGAEIQPLLLDTYSGASAAYSLRSLTNTRLTQPVVRVRRSSDNTEQDFSAKQITNGTLVGFCGTGDGLVTTWYDQSGNGNDATQTTAASQPKIVDSGVLVTENGKPAVDFDGVDDYLEAHGAGSIADGNNAFSVFLTSSFSDVLEPGKFPWSFGNSEGIEAHALRIQAGALEHQRIGSQGSERYEFAFSLVNDQQYLVFSAYNGTEIIGGIDGGTPFAAGDTQAIISDQFTIGALGRSSFQLEAETLTQELILYPSDQSANREAIEGNINAHYGIF